MFLTPGIAQSALFYLYTYIGQNASASLHLKLRFPRWILSIFNFVQAALQRSHGGPLRARTLFSTDWLGFCSSFVSETLCEVFTSCQEYHVSSTSPKIIINILSKQASQNLLTWLFFWWCRWRFKFSKLPVCEKKSTSSSCLLICYLCGICMFNSFSGWK